MKSLPLILASSLLGASAADATVMREYDLERKTFGSIKVVSSDDTNSGTEAT